MKSKKSDNLVQIKEELRNREAEIELLQQSLTDIASELDLEKVYQTVAQQALELIQAETVLISILDENCTTYTYRGAAGKNADEVLGETLPLDFGVCGWVWKHKKPWWAGALDDLSDDERERWKNEINHVVMTPLQGKKHFLGGISGTRKIDGSEFNQRDMNLLSLFSSVVAVSIENAMAVKNLELANKATEEYQFKLERSNRLLTESNRELEMLTLYDIITGLPNRSLFHDRLNQHIAITNIQKQAQGIGLLLIDLNNFKEINDTFGHDSGDLLLKKVASRILEHLDLDETASRLGGDEFAIILPECDEKQTIKKTGELLNYLKQPFEIDGSEVVIQGSVGIALFPEHGTDSSILLKHADLAMYTAKDNNKGYYVYEPDKDTSSIKQVTMIADLHKAVDENQFELHYQPKISMAEKRTTSVEALGRWQHPERGNIPPNIFIPVLEQSGLIDQYTYAIIEKALAQLRHWQSHDIDIKIAVNISTQTLNNSDFIIRVEQIVADEKYGRQLIFEITENLFLSEYDKLSETLSRLRYLGISLSIDDYGTGFSSLSRLKKLPVSELKIDQSFIQDMDHDKDDELIVLSTIELAHNLGLSVVAEGVETAATLRCLENLGCDIIQGYYISRPVPIEQLNDFLKSEVEKLPGLLNAKAH